MTNSPDDAAVIHEVEHWLTQVVIGLNLCPFAKAVHVKKQIRYVVVHAEDNDTDAVADALCEELDRLARTPADEIDTTLLIICGPLAAFEAYNDFLGVADAILDGLQYTGTFQIASFHPQYQFADTAIDDVSNCTNRAPYPLLHILREESVSRAVAAFPEAERIYEKNMETMHSLSAAQLRALGLKA
jgi:uncharacterized protein